MVPVEKPCASCPWLRKNQTPEVVAASPQDGLWFDPERLKKHWRGVARGQIMPCHSTDAEAFMYGGKQCPTGSERICVGLATLVHREITAMMRSGSEYKLYKLRKGLRMTAAGLAMWASRLYYAGAYIVVGSRNFRIPRVEDNREVTVPWQDNILTGGE